MAPDTMEPTSLRYRAEKSTSLTPDHPPRSALPARAKAADIFALARTL
jgi:hypothetical protein